MSVDIAAAGKLNLVFVHLGRGPRRHLLANIRSTRMRFPEAPITLVVDDTRTWRRILPRGVRLFRYTPESAEARLVQSVTQNIAFRKGFWLNTSRRFLALAQFHEHLDRPLLHIESDVALLWNPAAPVKASGKRWAYSLASDTMGVGAIVFSDGAASSRQLADFIIDYFASNPGASDMYALGAFFQAHYRDILVLPSATSVNSRAFRDGVPESFRRVVTDEFVVFDGVFDGAPLGCYLLGQDGRNHRGFRKIFQVLPFYDLDYSTCDFRQRDGRLEMNDSSLGWVAVYSLHVHSKHVGLLGPPSARTRALNHYCRLADGNRLPISEFDPWAFSVALRDAVGRRVSLLRRSRLFPR